MTGCFRVVCSDPNIFSWQLYNVNIHTFIHQDYLDLRACIRCARFLGIHSLLLRPESMLCLLQEFRCEEFPECKQAVPSWIGVSILPINRGRWAPIAALLLGS